MNPSPTSPARPPARQTGKWKLEIIRGRDVGRTFALDPGETVVGNALNGQLGIDLLEQEGNSPRRMAARQAVFACSGQDLSIQDLDSPGGTFVNQQRLLSGQPRKLSAGDVIQLGGVQLKVNQDAATAAPAAPAPTKAPVAAAPVTASPARDPQPAHDFPPPATRPVPPAKAADPKTPPPAARHLPPAKAADPKSPPLATGGSPPSPGDRLPAAFTMANGAQCRTWDDFLILSAQSWAHVRDELVSGRLVEYLRRIGRQDLIPHSAPDRSADDRLDDWLARIPATQASAPELDVYPQALLVQAKTGGGTTRVSLRITNVGFRLLRSSVRVEPASARWVKLLFGGDGRPFQTIEQTDIPVELELPETIDRVQRALIVIESNGGARRVEVRLEQPPDPLLAADAGGATAGLEIPIITRELRRRLGRVSPLARVAVCCGAAAGSRLLVALMNAAPLLGSGNRLADPRITSVAAVTVAAGVLGGLLLAKRRGERRDLLTAGLAGGLLGLLSSAPWFSMLQTAERILGAWSTSLAAVCLFWGALGAVLALGSTVFIPHQTQDRQGGP
jgi:hypothetical protein